MTERLEWLAERWIREVLARDAEIEEGLVRTVGPPAYRRLDVKGRALAYVRIRPKRNMVRIDVPGAWPRPPNCILALSSANGWALAIRTELDILDGVQAVLTSFREARSRSIVQASCFSILR
jgi:hypothetical protein